MKDMKTKISILLFLSYSEIAAAKIKMKNEKIVNKFSTSSLTSRGVSFSKLIPIMSGNNEIEQNFIESNRLSSRIKNDENKYSESKPRETW